MQSVKNHVRQLSEKKYQSAEGHERPDFVLLFMPIEPSFSVAIQGDTELFAYAWDRKIVIIWVRVPAGDPANHRFALGSRSDRHETALEIARVGGALYDKFKGFIDDLIDVGKKMDAAKAGSDAMNKLSSGPGNIIKRIEDFA